MTRNNPVCERLKSFRKYSDAVSGCEGQKQDQLEKTKSSDWKSALDCISF